MACFFPKQALRLDNVFTESGKSVVRFLKSIDYDKYKSDPRLLTGLPCKQCVGCRLERSRQWAIRCVNEAQLHDDNCFITLTFDQDSLFKRKNPMSLDKREFQLFIKRFRKGVSPKLRYYMCGEYGDLFKRPHYHAIIFGYDFSDKKFEKIVDGRRYYSSLLLRKFWPFGNNIITDVNFDTCAYVARYIMKKVLGKNSWKSYFEYFDELTGELCGHRIPEYTTMSRRSGIGKEWLVKYLIDVFPKDKIFMRGRGFSKPPKYYDSLYEIINPSDLSRIKEARILAASLQSSDNTPQRLEVKRVVKLDQLKSLKRVLE